MKSALLAAATVLVAAVWWNWPGFEPKSSRTQALRAEQAVAASAAAANVPTDPHGRSTVPQIAPGTGPQPIGLDDPRAGSSLAGTEIDGSVRFEPSGSLSADRDLRRYFDHWLGLLGEWPIDRIRNGIEVALEDLEAVQRAEVLALFERYVGLQRAAAALRLTGSMEERLQALIDLRRQLLGAEIADAFYGAEEQEQWRTLDRLALNRDPTLSDAEKSAAAALVDQSRPLPEQQARAAYTAHLAALEQTRNFDVQGVDAAQRHAERSARFGADAATRLAAMDAENAEFERQLREFRSARQGLVDDPTLSAIDRERAIAALLAARFDEAEQRRVVALDRIDRP